MRRFILPLALCFAAVTPARTARATPGFPAVVAEHLDLPTAPSCALCHAGTQARGTVTTPFGVTIRSRGLQAYDDDSLRTALDALAAENKDSDGDGSSDIDELEAGTDPNGAGVAVVPEYGCQSAPMGSRGSLAAAGLLALALGAARGRRIAKRKDGQRRR